MNDSWGCLVELATQEMRAPGANRRSDRSRLGSCRQRIRGYTRELNFSDCSTLDEGARHERQSCTMKIRDLATDGKPQARSRGLGCEERIEYLCSDGGINSSSFI